MRHAIAVAVVCAVGGAAAADGIEVRMRVDASHVSEDRAPELHATVIGAPALPADNFELREVGGAHGVAIATSRRTWLESGERLAVVVVLSGNMEWAEGTQLPDKPAYSIGFDGPMVPGSEGALVVYDAAASVKLPLGPIATLAHPWIGRNDDDNSDLGHDLRGGVSLGLTELEKSTAPVRLLLVLGDGTANDMTVDAAALEQLAARAAAEDIRVVQLVYKTRDSRPDVLRFGETRIATGHSHVEAMAAEIRAVTNRQYLVFPGEALPWDGAPHELALMIHGTATEPVELTSAAYDGPATHTPWAILFILGGGLLGLVAWTRWYSAGA